MSQKFRGRLARIMIFRNDFTLTKRHLGILAIIGGVVALLLSLLADVGGGDAEFGPTQQLGLVLSLVAIALGLSLLPLGDDPA